MAVGFFQMGLTGGCRFSTIWGIAGGCKNIAQLAVLKCAGYARTSTNCTLSNKRIAPISPMSVL